MGGAGVVLYSFGDFALGCYLFCRAGGGYCIHHLQAAEIPTARPIAFMLIWNGEMERRGRVSIDRCRVNHFDSLRQYNIKRNNGGRMVGLKA
mmetsp:Transcript_10027/g.21674  ORF Transcript_10027/g.21674 Transcript_10027/m.21674 type:complete len:92 (+) Transcript_10027:445-720(+)